MRDRTKKMRGSGTFGMGKKGARGGGTKGGKGNAGLHKHKYIYMIKYAPDAYGRKGFKSKNRVEKRVINVGDLNRREGDFMDLREEGYDKLLGSGRVERAITVVVDECSASAKAKIEAAGGKVTNG
jgi:large subunit ribosomal protein L15